MKRHEAELWSWASSAAVRNAVSDELRTAMLKANYRLDAEGHPDLVERCGRMAELLEISAPVTLYQSTAAVGMNAALCFSPGEAHIVFAGPILATLKETELDAVLAHELAHYRLWEIENGDYLVADRLFTGAANDPRAASSHIHTARRFQLYTEIYADRCSLAACGDLEGTVAALVKTETGLTHASGASYLRQADEIFSKGDAISQGLDHPETFIRAKALQLWSEQNEELEAWLRRVIEGPLTLDGLDSLSQGRMAALTRRLIAQLLRPKWFQSAAVLAHAKSFFSDFVPASAPDESLPGELATEDAPTREYYAYLLLDFATADRELDDVPMACTLDWASRLGLAAEFEKLLSKDAGLGKRQLAKLKKEAPTILKQTEASA